MAALIWNVLKWLDCWITDKWTGRDWGYYSAVLGRKQANGMIRNKWHQWHIANLLDWIDKNHCRDAMTAPLPPKDFNDALRS